MGVALIAMLFLQAAAPPRPAPSNTDLPAWSKTPSQAEMTAAYPPEALKQNLAGSAMVECTVGAAGELTACAVTGESVPQFGFGAAALSLAPKFQVPLKSPSGAAMAGRTVQFPMRWLNQAKSQAPPIIVYEDSGRTGQVVFNCRVNAERGYDNCVFVDAKPPGNSLLKAAGEAALRQKAPPSAKPGGRLMVVVQLKAN